MSSVSCPSAPMNLSGMNRIGSGYFFSLCVIDLAQPAFTVSSLRRAHATYQMFANTIASTTRIA